jgi:hypothetical protein
MHFGFLPCVQKINFVQDSQRNVPQIRARATFQIGMTAQPFDLRKSSGWIA